MRRIFLVEDDGAIARNLTCLLRSEDFAVTQASTQAEAFSILNEERFDLALVDVSLPDGNGFTVCRPIIIRQGGTVSAGNHPQGGAMFYIRFPE